MKTVSRFTLSLSIACLGAACGSLAQAQPLAAPTVATTPVPCSAIRLTGLERRVADKASQGVKALRQYVTLTRAIHHLDLQDAIDWYTAHRARNAACTR